MTTMDEHGNDNHGHGEDNDQEETKHNARRMTIKSREGEQL